MLEIHRLKVSYSGVQVLKGINLALEEGETLGIIGESGAGKTTLALTLMGLCQGQIEGKILIHGKDLLSLTEDNLRKLRWNEIAMVCQDAGKALNPVMTVFEQIREPMLEHKLYKLEEAEKRVYRLLAEVGLSPQIACAYPHQLSGGEKQRVLLAMALANNPRVLILDEPTSALDAMTKAEVLKLLARISKGLTVILVTHDISVAAKLADRIAVLYSGMVMELGPTEVILKRPRHPYTRGLLRSFPNMSTTKDLQGVPGTREHVTQGCPFHPRCTQRIEVCGNALPELKGIGDREIACHRGGIVPLLQIKDLAKRYGSVTALKGVSMEIDEGETIAVVGESGSGKSTLAKCIMGLEKADAGRFIFQRTTLQRDKNFYKNVQLIFQNPQESISHRLSVLEAVMEPLNIQCIAKPRERVDIVKKTLKEVELPTSDAFLSRYAHQLSGGELQRVAIARALVLNPKLLIADEPTSALDASVQAKIMKLLLNLQERRGLAIVFITHDLALARKVSDKVAVMLSGNIVETGATSEVFALPRHPYTQDLLQAAPDFELEIRHFSFAGINCQGACPYAFRCRNVSPICLTKEPETYELGLRKVKCHLYSRVSHKNMASFG